MSHSHDDRIADTLPGMCAAYGCPLHGANSNATNGSSDWWCSLHFGREGDLQAVTSAINRNRWLADAITLVRGCHPANPNRQADHTKAFKLLRANGRDDLQWAGGAETIRQWINRIEPELHKLVLAELTVPAQTPLPEQADTWAKASSRMPNFA